METGFPVNSLKLLSQYTTTKTWSDSMLMACFSIIAYGLTVVNQPPQQRIGNVGDPNPADMVAFREIANATSNQPANWAFILDYSLEVIRSRAFLGVR